LPQADGSGFVALNGGFRAENRSLISQDLSVTTPNCLPQSGHSMLEVG
jgi:hypothetical protein